MDLDRNCRLVSFRRLSSAYCEIFPAVSRGSPRGGFCGSTLWIFQFGALARELDPGEGFSLQAGGLLQHRGFQCDSLWASLHVRLALCSLDSSCVLELWEGFLLQFLPPQERNFVTLQVQGSFEFKTRGFSSSVDCLD